MEIIEKTYILNGSLQTRSKTDMIILHHAVYNGDVEGIDRIHKGKGWTCIGYHFYVRKDGSIYRGRREDTVGAHAYGSNGTSIGICAEGNFENDIMGAEQKNAIIELVGYLKGKYGINKVIRHKDVGNTACPGRNYPFDEIVSGSISPVNPVQPTPVTGKIADIQKTLNDRYGFGIAVDNIYGPATKKALVKALQRELDKQLAANLIVDGIFGPATKSKCPNVKQGDRGNITWTIQAMLVCKGYSLVVDGIFGADTKAKIKTFQSTHGLVSDGIVGKNTFEKMFK